MKGWFACYQWLRQRYPTAAEQLCCVAGRAHTAQVSGVDVGLRREHVLHEGAQAVRPPYPSPETAQEAVDTIGSWTSTMVVVATDGGGGSAAAVSATAASPATSQLTMEGSPVKTAAGHPEAAGASAPDRKSKAEAARSGPISWDPFAASGSLAAETSPTRPAEAASRHAQTAADAPGSDERGTDGPLSGQAHAAFGPQVRSHHKVQLVVMDQAGEAAEATCNVTDTLASVLELVSAQLHQGHAGQAVWAAGRRLAGAASLAECRLRRHAILFCRTLAPACKHHHLGG